MHLSSALRVNPDNGHHQSLEDEVIEYLEGLGFKTIAAPYHDTMPPAIVELLRRRWTLTDLYLRARADRIAIHRQRALTFEFECKTHINPRYKDMALELLPLVHHFDKARRGVKCLYCYHNPFTAEDGGFWIQNMPRPRVLMLPLRGCWVEHHAELERWANDLWPDVPVKRMPVVFGSGDPFVVIDSSSLLAMASWQDLIRDTLK